ncbi:MAG: aldo/keto reductase [Chloroflexi bacterium HGW-Chloroflexi-4]|jgi:voltage-dependent potassium channel beta subunit|nr:MAG: aldo/keto reductase [Chloroflexi bacterium HGW-Chloroflexi-4]
MEYRHLGKTGLRVSALSYGSWVTFHTQVGIDAAVESMSIAYESGVNFFDNAEVYASGKSEEVMGAAFKKLGWRRGSYLVSTKLFWGLNEGVNEKNTLNRKYLIEAMNGSLKRLDLEHVDLLFCHRPDASTPIEETVWAMHNLIEWGKALYWGTSEWSASEIISAIEIAERHHLHKPVMEQPQYNLLWRDRMEKEYARLFKDYGYGTTIFSPLGAGLLTGKYNNGIPADSRGALSGYEWLREKFTDQEALEKVKQLGKLAEEIGITLPKMAIAWCLKNPNVSTVITGASRVTQMHENMKAMDVVDHLTPDVMNRIDEILSSYKKNLNG